MSSETPATSPASSKAALFVVNILTATAGNNPQYRVASELCPGKRGSEWRAGDLARRGYAELLRIRLAQLMAEFGIEGVKKECRSRDANEAAWSGCLEVVRELRAHGIHCTSGGADMTAAKGHLDVVRDLRANGIDCTSYGADWAAQNGHLHVVRDLRAHNIHCTSRGADLAAVYGRVEVIQD